MFEKVCRACGGALIREGNYLVCEYCQRKELVDVSDDIHAVARANAWEALRKSDFEKATELFEELVVKNDKDYDSHWGLALARASIVYVNDVIEGKKVPTLNNITEDSFIADKAVKTAISLAPKEIAESYREHAEYIEKVRVEWLEKASKEPPYDVFISFKDSDREHGITRTTDSQTMQDLYTALVEKGYKVFYSRVTLKDKVSEQYEPYVYNAIKTAKVMIVYGEKAEYFNSTWIKNEWMRFKKRVESGEKHKNALVTVFKGVDPYEIPTALTGGRQAIDYSIPSNYEVLLNHVKTIVSESKQAKKLDKIEIKGGQMGKKSSEIKTETLQTREVGSSAVETSITDKQTLKLATYAKAGDFVEAEARKKKVSKIIGTVVAIIVGIAVCFGTIVGIFTAIDHNARGGLNLQLSSTNDYYIVAKQSAADKNLQSVVIPAEYKGLPVKGIDNHAFENCRSLTSITIPDSVTSIGYGAFFYCISLTSIVIPDSVTSIGYNAFYNCSKLQYNIEGGLKYLGNANNPYLYLADATSTSITSATINENCKIIGEYAFYDCSKLQYNIEGGLKYLGNANNPYLYLADATSTSITSATINDNCKFIGDYAFEYCSRLTSVTIPESVTSIGSYAFNNCSSLTSVVIPDSVTSIGYRAFYDCSSLTSVVIGDSVTSISWYAFSGCSSLTSITIPDSVNYIGGYAFHSCSSLTSVVIGDSVTSIDGNAFSGCSSLTSITFKDTSTWYRTTYDSYYTGGTQTSVTDPSTNATYFKSTYNNYYWYKK